MEGPSPQHRPWSSRDPPPQRGDPPAPLRALPPAAAPTILYMVWSSAAAAFPPGHTPGIYLGTANAGAGRALSGDPRRGATGNAGRGGVGRSSEERPGRGVTFAEPPESAGGVPVIGLTSGRPGSAAPPAGGCAKVTARGQDAPASWHPRLATAGLPGSASRERPAAGTARHGGAPAAGSPPCPRASPLPVTGRR